MIYSFAPMEGITNCIYRSVHNGFFGGADVYYAPFISPDSEGKCKASALKDILPENNKDLTLVPQILSNNPDSFLSFSALCRDLGYNTVNLNAGCPSGTVFPKKKGAGMLQDIEALDVFLDKVFSHCPTAVSVKTRMGVESTDEFPRLLEIYNKYPISELVVHARARSGYYKSVPDMAMFVSCSDKCSLPLVYNGNATSAAEAMRVVNCVSNLNGIMIGRGAAANPALFRQIRGGDAASSEELRDFHGMYYDALKASGLSSHYILSRMKELWYYMECMFPSGKKQLKAVYKATSIDAYLSAAGILFASGTYSPDAQFNK